MLASNFWDLGNSVDPDQMPQNAASDQGLHYLRTGFLLKRKIKIYKNDTIHPLNDKWIHIDKDGKVH